MHNLWYFCSLRLDVGDSPPQAPGEHQGLCPLQQAGDRTAPIPLLHLRHRPHLDLWQDRIKDLVLDPTAFLGAATLQEDENLGRLKTTSVNGDTDDNGDFIDVRDRSLQPCWDA